VTESETAWAIEQIRDVLSGFRLSRALGQA